MKHIYVILSKIFIWVLVSVAFLSCDSRALDGVTEDEPSLADTVMVRFTVLEGAGIQSRINNMVLCGDNNEAQIVNAGTPDEAAVFRIVPFQDKKSYFFVANLNDNDRTRVKATDPAKFNDIVLDIWDYIVDETGKEPTPENYPSVPMVAMFQRADQFYIFNYSAFSLTRLFAMIHYKIVFPASTSIFQLEEVRVMNYPTKFALADPIDSYDLSVYASDLADINMGTNPPEDAKVFIPEHYVSNPSFYDADDHGMTYLKIGYSRTEAFGATKHYTIGVRIGEYGTDAYRSYGQIVRGRVYNAVVNIPDIHIPEATNSFYFLN